MAVISPTRSEAGHYDVWAWTGVTENDTFGTLPQDSASRNITMQVSGTFGGSTVIVQASNNSDFAVITGLSDLTGTAISLTAAGAAQINYAWPYIRPSASGGTSQSLTVTMAVLR